MLITTFLIYLVFSTFKFSSIIEQSIILNRLGIINLIFILGLFISSINYIGLTPGLTLYNNWFILSSYNFPIIILILSFIIFILVNVSTNNRYNLPSNNLILIILANTLGLILFPLCNDLISIYVIIELQSYSLYILTGLYNRSYNASKASLLYFLMGGIASTIILLASYYIYKHTGTTNISDILIINKYTNSYDYFDILLIAFLFKMGMAPLHRWSIAVYNYAPTFITGYISIVAKLSIIAWIYTHISLFNNYILILTFYLSLIIGSYKPLFNINIKTILVYSGLLNFGYLMLSVITYDISFYLYLIQYVLTHLLLFLILNSINNYMINPNSKWSPVTYIHDLKLPNISLAFCMIIALFSLIGIPPLPGFYAKLYILISALSENYILETIILITCSVIATYYYGNIIRILFNSKDKINEYYISPSIAYIISLSTILLLVSYLFIPIISEALYIITI